MNIAQIKKRLRTLAIGSMLLAGLVPAQAYAVSQADTVDAAADAPLPMPKSTRHGQSNDAPAQAVQSAPQTESAEVALPKPTTSDPNTPEKSSDQGFNTEDFLPQKGTTSGSKKKVVAPVDNSNKIFVRVQLTVPHSTQAVHKLVAYPYPMALPKARKEIFDLPTDTRTLKEELLSNGYTQRGSSYKPYPFQGWRFQYAYHNALKRSHAEEPSVIGDIYPFVAKMVPYIREEIKKVNNTEHERVERYKRLSEEYEQHSQEAETEATRKGYVPVPVEINKMWRGHFNIGELKLGEGTWYITGTKKVPGITYYWQQAVEVTRDQPVVCELTEDNALIVEGGW